MSTSPKILFRKEVPEAVTPTKAHATDVGYDLTIISRDQYLTGLWHGRVLAPEVILYDTGISVQPDEGYYLEVVPRSSFSKSGYVLANGVGIIDPSYRGTIKVALVKLDKIAPEIPLPYRGFQLIVRKLESALFVQTDDDFTETPRGTGGFGSTNATTANQSPSSLPITNNPSRTQQRKTKNQNINSDIRNDPTSSALPSSFHTAFNASAIDD
jgi:deoxyuridine 5'-triphosphate nucleotidohydrolase